MPGTGNTVGFGEDAQFVLGGEGPPPGAGRNFRRRRVRCRHNRRPAASADAGTGHAIDRIGGKLHRHGDGDPSAPSRVNFRGVCVSSSLLGWTAPRHQVPELGQEATKTGAAHDPV